MRRSLARRFTLVSCLALSSCSTQARRDTATDRSLTISVEVYRVAGGVASSESACRVEPDATAIVIGGREIPVGQTPPGVERLAAPRVTCLPDQPAVIEIASEPEQGRPGRGLRLSMTGRHENGGSILLERFAAEITEHALDSNAQAIEHTRRAELSFSLPPSHHAVITLPAISSDEPPIAMVVRAS